MATPKKKVKRRHTRYRPDDMITAELDLRTRGSGFQPSVSGLVWSESYGGAGVVMLHNDRVIVGNQVHIRIGDIGPVLAEVKWKVELDEDVCKVGIQFLE